MREEGTNIYNEITTPYNVVTTLTITSGFNINKNYFVKIAAMNNVGLGQYSSESTFLSDNVP